jgi:enamine deaminase RidA (YjgF/YER057c/UK114 family)
MSNARPRAIGATVDAIEADGLTLLSTTVPDAACMDAEALRAHVTHAYAAIGDALRSIQRTAIRLWNYLPDPGCLMAPGLDRYMVFNAGRHEGYRRWSAEPDRFERSLATASGVGIPGDDLVIHCLASQSGGYAVENPRQKPAWQYSARYGPFPPAFSRATIAAVGARQLLLIGGTASIVGEDSLHDGNLQGQIEETFTNLTTLVAAGHGNFAARRLPLACVTDVRVYVRRDEDAAAIGARVRASVSGTARIEMAIATLCRPELLVEIEGVAEIR